ncbi:XRE family transcriptional regulator [Ralstonia sp.]|uniref:XRE family transcriptional regulator n=1 Tax=Ralstonia sp. TaxID=54061 RepID=UPI0031E16961
MKIFRQYTPPSTTDLAKLKGELGLTGEQMAQLAAVAGSNQWRKYTGGHAPRELSLHMLFLIAARLTLSEQEFERIIKKMRDLGASVDFSEMDGGPASPPSS